MSPIQHNAKAMSRASNRATVSAGREAIERAYFARYNARCMCLTVAGYVACGLGIVLALVAWL